MRARAIPRKQARYLARMARIGAHGSQRYVPEIKQTSTELLD
jgi:hypothetical protein